MPELTTSNARIAYRQTGSGPDIVWVSGGGDPGDTWHEWQIPALPGYRHTTFDNRGIGATECTQPLPWTIADFARGTSELIEAVCDPPVVVAGLSMGGFIVLQLAIDRPDLVRCGISMGTAARADGWLYDYMKAEVGFRQAGGELVGRARYRCTSSRSVRISRRRLCAGGRSPSWRAMRGSTSSTGWVTARCSATPRTS
jgi:pimeloyl-ACP methyl ester carboxylesterase